MNSVNLVGRLTKDPELSERGGRKVCDLRIAVNGIGEAPPLFIDVVTFNAQAEACRKYLSKGSRISVSGALRLSEWETNGKKCFKHSVLARGVLFLEGKREVEGEAEGASEGAEVGVCCGFDPAVRVRVSVPRWHGDSHGEPPALGESSFVACWVGRGKSQRPSAPLRSVAAGPAASSPHGTA